MNLAVTREVLVAAFDEWLARYNANAEEFDAEYPSDGSYGENCTAYLVDKLIPAVVAGNG